MLLLLTPFVLLRTPTDIFPAINIPVVNAVWLYNGLSAKEMEDRIITDHGRMIRARVADIEHIESTSYNGAGVIKVFLQPGASVSDGVAQITASGQAVLRFLSPGPPPRSSSATALQRFPSFRSALQAASFPTCFVPKDLRWASCGKTGRSSCAA